MNLNHIRGTYNHDTLKYLRYNATNEWRDKALKAANYKCEVSGRKTSKKDYLINMLPLLPQCSVQGFIMF